MFTIMQRGTIVDKLTEVKLRDSNHLSELLSICAGIGILTYICFRIYLQTCFNVHPLLQNIYFFYKIQYKHISLFFTSPTHTFYLHQYNIIIENPFVTGHRGGIGDKFISSPSFFSYLFWYINKALIHHVLTNAVFFIPPGGCMVICNTNCNPTWQIG